MPTVELDQDVYDHLVRNTRVLGEGASSILRRLLELRGVAAKSQIPSARTAGPSNGDAPNHGEELLAFVSTPEFSGQRNVTEKFIVLLEFLHKHHRAEFQKVLTLRGRRRAYFGRSESDIRQSGTHTHPRQIPDSTYWVLTNASNFHKREITRRALERLGYPSELASKIIDSLK